LDGELDGGGDVATCLSGGVLTAVLSGDVRSTTKGLVILDARDRDLLSEDAALTSSTAGTSVSVISDVLESPSSSTSGPPPPLRNASKALRKSDIPRLSPVMFLSE
jgi:hypothetical protein